MDGWLFWAIVLSDYQLETSRSERTRRYTFFGKPINEVESGLVFVPMGICSLVKETALIIQEQYPDDPRKCGRETLKKCLWTERLCHQLE